MRTKRLMLRAWHQWLAGVRWSVLDCWWHMERMAVAEQRDLLDSVNVDYGGEG